MITFSYRQNNYTQLAIQHPGTFEKTKENQLAIKKSFSRNAKAMLQKNSTNQTKLVEDVKDSNRRAKTTENRSSGMKTENTPALYLTTNNKESSRIIIHSLWPERKETEQVDF